MSRALQRASAKPKGPALLPYVFHVSGGFSDQKPAMDLKNMFIPTACFHATFGYGHYYYGDP